MKTTSSLLEHFCGYLKMLEKKTGGMGFTEILLKADLMIFWPLMGAVLAKNYACSLNCHKVLKKVLKRLLLACFLQNQAEEIPFGKLPSFAWIVL